MSKSARNKILKRRKVHNQYTHISLGKTFPRVGKKCRLYMSFEQEERFNNDSGKCRFVYNSLLSKHNEYYNQKLDEENRLEFLAECEWQFKGIAKPKEIKIDKKLDEISKVNEHAFRLIYNDLNKEYDWLKEMNQKVIWGAAKNLLKAFNNFFEHPESFGYPKLKKKKVAEQKCTFNSQCFSGIYGNTVNLTNEYKDMRFDCSKNDMSYLNRYQDYIQTTTVSKTKSGKYFISFSVGDFLPNLKYQQNRIPDGIEDYAALLEDENDEVEVITDDESKVGTYLMVTDKTTGEVTWRTATGYDLGITDKVISSDGKKAPNNRFLKNAQNELKHHQRLFSKKQPKSAGLKGLKDFEIPKNTPCAGRNREKERIEVAKRHERVSNMRETENRQLASQMLMKNDLIILEDLNILGMEKNHCLAAAIADAGWGLIYKFIEEGVKRYGRTVIKVGRFYPSSRLCPHCGQKHEGLELSDRAWVCPHCGHVVEDRDINAAENILKEGIQIYRAMLGDDYSVAVVRVKRQNKVGLSLPDFKPDGEAPVGESMKQELFLS